MNRSLLDDAFAHHSWASLKLIDACLALTEEQLATSVPGTYGSILDTARHLVGADVWYLHRMSDQRWPTVDEDSMSLPELHAAQEVNAARWVELLSAGPDPDTMVNVRWEDGSETRAPFGIRLAQALHHGTDHRSQVCTALTTLGIEPPNIDVWAYGEAVGRVVEVPPTA
jgi:uncharacterized damage-inducible protein DinB